MASKGKVVDKWKQKKWFNVVSPAIFDSKPLCELIATEDHQLMNRIIKTSLADLGMTGASQIANFTSLKFRINNVKGDTANTKLIGHEVAPSFIKTFARRGRSLIHQVVDVKSKDGVEIRIKIIAVTGAKVSENTKRNIRALVVKQDQSHGSSFNLDGLVQEILYGRFVSKLYNSLKAVTKMKRVEIRKSEIKEVFA